MDRDDLESICRAGWIQEGDGWWEQFLTAFAWQHQVEKYGVEVYDDWSGSVRIMAPISVEHVEALVQVLVRREMIRRREEGGALEEAGAQALVDKVIAEAILRLTSMDKILTLEMEVEIIPDTECTRALTDLLGGSGAAETPYTRTLLFAYEWANAEMARQLGDSGVQ